MQRSQNIHPAAVTRVIAGVIGGVIGGTEAGMTEAGMTEAGTTEFANHFVKLMRLQP